MKTALQQFQFYDKYSKWDSRKNRRETWVETVTRATNFLRELSDNKLSDRTYADIFDAIYHMEVLPSMRLLAMAGAAGRRDNTVLYNCSFAGIEEPVIYRDMLNIMMSGCGVGFSVERKYTEKFDPVPENLAVDEDFFILVEDSAHGWANAYYELILGLFEGRIPVEIDYSLVRPAGAVLQTKGGRASGPAPLQDLMEYTIKTFKNAAGRKLTSVEHYDITTKMASCIISGGVRRVACICLFDFDDKDMRNAKNDEGILGSGTWEKPERAHRWAANNSAVIKGKLTKEEISELMDDMHATMRGEPGIFSEYAALNTMPEVRKDWEGGWGTNPCLTGDTKVAVADGRGTVTIKQLAEEGKDVPVFALDTEGNVVARMMRHPRKTGAGKAVYQVTLDNGATFKATSNHKMYTANGTQIAVAELLPGDSLYAITRKDGMLYNNGEGVSERAVANTLPFFATELFGANTEAEALEMDKRILSVMAELTASYGRKLTVREWWAYAATQEDIPQGIVGNRAERMGSLGEILSDVAKRLGLPYDSQQDKIAELKKQGYKAYVKNNRVTVEKVCEQCSKAFEVKPDRREASYCSRGCYKASDRFRDHMTRANIARLSSLKEKAQVRTSKQLAVYTQLKFDLGRDPIHREWQEACRASGVSVNLSKFGNWGKLKKAAVSYNHRVVSVEFVGYEDVYNGTVDDFHNFFIGGFSEADGSEGFLLTKNCGEILLRHKQFCNLSAVVARHEDNFENIQRKVRLATIIGTIQSSATYFPHLSDGWQQNAEAERLLGVDITGQYDTKYGVLSSDNLERLRDFATEINVEFAEKLGINVSHAITCNKPSGNSSVLVNCASGIHPRHSKYYIRRARLNVNSPIFKMLRDSGMPLSPENGQDAETATTWVVSFPVKSPGNTFKTSITALEFLKNWKKNKLHWTHHNPSATCSYWPEELEEIKDWLFENQDIVGGISFLPQSDFKYDQAPYEEISEVQYYEMVDNMPLVDYNKLAQYESEDWTTAAQELACVAGNCEI